MQGGMCKRALRPEFGRTNCMFIFGAHIWCQSLWAKKRYIGRKHCRNHVWKWMFIPILLTHLLGPMSSHTWFRCDAQIWVTWDFSHAGISNLKPWSIGWMNTWTPRIYPYKIDVSKKNQRPNAKKDMNPISAGYRYLPGAVINIPPAISKKNTMWIRNMEDFMGPPYISSWQLPGSCLLHLLS